MVSDAQPCGCMCRCGAIPLVVCVWVAGSLLLSGFAGAAEIPIADSRSIRDIREEYSHRSWTRENGLPDNEVTAILQTRDGYLWVATPFALARFDGTRFVVFDQTAHPELGKGRLHTLTEDNSGTLWIATREEIVTYNGEGFKRTLTGDFGWFFHPIAPARGGGVWLCDSRLQLRHLTRTDVISTNKIRFKDALHSGYVDSLIELADGRFWVGDDMGSYLLDSTCREVQKVRYPHAGFFHFPVLEPDGSGYDLVLPHHDNEKHAQLYSIQKDHATLCATNFINTMGRMPFLTRDRSGALWMPGGQKSLFRYAQGQMTRFLFPGGSDAVSWSYEDRGGTLWLGGYACCAHADREGNLWFGTTDSGLHCLRPLRARALTLRDGLTGAFAECLLQTRDGSVWIGTENGLTRFDTNGCASFSEREGLILPAIRSLAEDQHGVLWVGTFGGLHSFENGRFVHHLLPIQGDLENRVRAILPSRTGGLWVATAGGLVRVARGRLIELTTRDGLSASDVLSLLEDPSGALWAGTRGGGLNRLSWPKPVQEGPGDPLEALKNVTVEVAVTTNHLSSNSICTLHQDADGVIWIGTDNGLGRYENGTCRVLTVEHGLPENSVNALLEDDSGMFWIGGDCGVYRVSRQDLNWAADGTTNKVAAVRYDQSDGFPSRTVSGKLSHPAMGQTRDGRLWIGTSGGVAILDPKDMPDTISPPRVIIEQIRANGQIVFDNGPQPAVKASDSSSPQRVIENGRSQIANSKSAVAQRPNQERRRSEITDLKLPIHFAPGTARILEIQYTATAFTSPEVTRFKYFLEGWDKEWVDPGTSRKAYYANLAPGDYRFHLVAADRNGRWGDMRIQASFHLAPFFYETGWFYGFCAIGLGSAGYLGVASRLRKTRQIAELTRQVALDNQRKRIARDVHDELGASLTQIVQLSDDVQRFREQPTLAESQARQIASLAEEVVANIGEIVWANNPGYDTLQDSIAFLREYAAKYLSTAGIESRLVFPQDVPERSVTGPFRRHLLSLLKEALHNTLKHSGAAAVDVTLVLTPTNLQLTVRDYGNGFHPAASSHFGNGLVNMRERCAELGGSCAIESKAGEGTSVSVILPFPEM